MSKEKLTNWISSKRYLHSSEKEKKHPIEKILKSVLFISTFNKMGEEDLSNEDIDTTESFTYSMFGWASANQKE